MKHINYYKNKTTGEVTTDVKEANKWYNDNKDEIEVWYFSNALSEWVMGLEWIH